MARKKRNWRRRYYGGYVTLWPKKTKFRPDYMSPGKLVAVAEWRPWPDPDEKKGA